MIGLGSDKNNVSNASKSSATVSHLSSIEKRKIVEVLSPFPIYSVGGGDLGIYHFRLKTRYQKSFITKDGWRFLQTLELNVSSALQSII